MKLRMLTGVTNFSLPWGAVPWRQPNPPRIIYNIKVGVQREATRMRARRFR